MMGQIPEGQQSEALKIPLDAGEEKFENGTALATICVYGYGPTKSPFYEEAQTVRANSEGGLLILGAPVSCGQKLLLINGRGSNPVEAQIVNTRTLGAQMCEVEVAFPFPQPEFWRPLRGGAKKKDVEKRRFPRVTLPQGDEHCLERERASQHCARQVDQSGRTFHRGGGAGSGRRYDSSAIRHSRRRRSREGRGPALDQGPRNGS